MNIKRVGLKVYFDYRWENERVRGAIPIDILSEIIRGEITKGDSNLGELGKVISFKEFASNIYLPRCSKPNKKETTYQGEVDSVKILNRFFAELLIHKITAENREKFKEDRLSGALSKNGRPVSHDRINNNLSCLNQIMAYAEKLKYIKQNPLQGLKRLPSGNRLDKWLRKQQVETLLDVCRDNFKNFVEFSILTGARENEALKLNVKDFNQSKTEFRLLTLKGRKSKGAQFRWFNVCSLGKRFGNLIERMKPHPDTGYYFCNEEGHPLASSSVQHTFAKVREKVGLTDRRLHDLRHTFAMHRAMAGINFWQLRVEMGHVSVASIQRYLDEAKSCDKTESIFYQKIAQLSVVENRQKRTEKRTENPENYKILEAVK